MYIASAVAIGVCAAVFVTKHMRVEFNTEGSIKDKDDPKDPKDTKEEK